MQDPIVFQAGAAYIIAHLIEFLKRTRFCPWLDDHSEAANNWTGSMLAAIASFGVTFTSNVTWETGGIITIHIPPVAILAEAVARYAAQKWMQGAVYKNLIKPPVVGGA